MGKNFADLPALTALDSADLIPVWDASAGVSKNITSANLANTMLSNAVFATRSAFVTWAGLITPATGTVIRAGGFDYRYVGTGTAISDLPGWIPNLNAYPEHWGANPNNSADCTPAIQAAINWLNSKSNGGTLYFAANTDATNPIYAIGSTIILKPKVALDATGARLRAKAAMAAMVDTVTGVGNLVTNTYITGGFWDGQLADRVFRVKEFQNLLIGGGGMNLYGAKVAAMTLGDTGAYYATYGAYVADLIVSRPNSAYDLSAVAAIDVQGFSDSNFSRLLLMGYPKGITGLAYISRFAQIHVWSYPLTQGQLLTGFDCQGGQNVYVQCQVDTPYTAAYWITSGDNYRFIGCTSTFGDGTQPGPTDNTVPMFQIDLAANVQMAECFGNDRADRRFSAFASGTLTNVHWNSSCTMRYGAMGFESHLLRQQLAAPGSVTAPSWSFSAYPDTGFAMSGASLQLSIAGAEWMRWDRTNKTMLIGSTANLQGTAWGAIQITGTGVAGDSNNLSLARASTDASGPIAYLAKYRGAKGSYGLVAANDVLGNLYFHGGDGSTTVRGAGISAIAEGTPASGDVRASLRFYTASAAAGVVTEAMRIDTSQNTGLGNVTPSVRLDVNGQIRTRGTTVASLPTAATAGAGTMAYVTDATANTRLSTAAGGGANKVMVYSDGTNWLIL